MPSVSDEGPKIQLDDLALTAALSITATEIDRANRGFSEKWLAMWADILWIAEEFADLHVRKQDTTRSWHHLLLAVGNFKRSAGNMQPAALPRPSGRNQTPAHVTFPGGGETQIHRDQSDTWRGLQVVPGLGEGVPTTSTLLSALWPGHHVIIDVRDERAAIGLGWAASLPDDAEMPGRNWGLYNRFLPMVKATAASIGREPIEVERALYCLDDKVMRVLNKEEMASGRRWTWSDYGSEMSAALK